MESIANQDHHKFMFSPDGQYVNHATSEGFFIYSTDPAHPVHENKLREVGDTKLVQNINNLFVYLRGNEESMGLELYIYDDYHSRVSSKFVLNSEIKSIKLTENCFDTCSNPKAIGCLLSRKDRNVVILPDIKEKCVQIYDSSVENNLVVYDLKTTPTILSGNIYGDVFAYANINGKTIYVHNLIDGTLQMEFDRGGDYAEINCIAFEKYCRRMAITSNKDTIHCFTLPKDWVTEQTEESQISDEYDALERSTPSNLGASVRNYNPGFLKRLITGGRGEKSYLKVYLKGDKEKTCAFVENKLLILCTKGSLYSINVECQGEFYDDDKELTETKLYELSSDKN